MHDVTAVHRRAIVKRGVSLRHAMPRVRRARSGTSKHTALIARPATTHNAKQACTDGIVRDNSLPMTARLCGNVLRFRQNRTSLRQTGPQAPS